MNFIRRLNRENFRGMEGMKIQYFISISLEFCLIGWENSGSWSLNSTISICELYINTCNYNVTVSTEEAPELALRSNFLSTFGMALDQGGKLGLGKSRSLVTFYGNSQVRYHGN